LCFSFAVLGNAQSDRSALRGTVADQNGAALPEVFVRAVQPSTGLTRETITGGDGSYAMPQLPVGQYVVNFTKNGFTSLRVENVDQIVGATRTLDVTLRVADRNEEVTISSTAAELDRTTSSLGGSIERKQVSELPLNGRN
jgi:hypothetical protein